MKFFFILHHPHHVRWLTVAAAATLIAFTAGCASPAPPQPPSLNLPETVSDLTAQRTGDAVKLLWTTPGTTTDHLPVQGAMTAEICRVALSLAPAACVPIARFKVQPGATQTTDKLPANLIAEPTTLLAYRVQILNKSGRSAGPAPQVFVASGAAPPSVDQLRVTPTRDGAMLEWQQQDTAAAVELDRLPIAPNGVVIEPAPTKAPAKSSSKTTIKKRATAPPKPPSAPKPFQATPPAAASTEVKLRTPAQSTDAGGTIDHTAQMGESYRYTAQRVRSVTLGGHALEMRSVASPPVTVVMRNIFPPHPPTGLEAVPGGATSADRSIDLSWTPNTDTNLAGYSVYRQQIDSKGVAAGTATRLNATPVVGPAYRDQTAVAGHRYAYRVTAVDAAGNESAPSDPVEETLREQ